MTCNYSTTMCYAGIRLKLNFARLYIFMYVRKQIDTLMTGVNQN